MAYCTTCDVFALTRSLVGPASAYDINTCPTLAQVTVWVTAGSSAIDTQLANAGYGPIPTTSAAYGLAGQANALFGAWFAERSRVNARVSADERTRAEMFKKDYESMMEYLLGLDLSLVGAALLVTATPYAGGISVSDKAAVTANTDRVTPRFERNFGRNSERG